MTCYAFYEYQMILFSLTNILATFQGYINKILIEKLNIFIIVYLDKIFFYYKNRKKYYVKVI